MKMIKYILNFVLIAIIATACHNYDEPNTHDYVSESEAWKATHTIHEFLEEFLTKEGTKINGELKYPPRARSHKSNDATKENLGLFSVDDIPADSIVGDVIIVGRIQNAIHTRHYRPQTRFENIG